jgi:quinoprotein glucose dehydrogenase
MAAVAVSGALVIGSALGGQNGLPDTNAGWASYNGQLDGTHYSSLAQINRFNVDKLRVAWTYDMAEADARFECNPIVIGRVLYGFTPSLKVLALDAASGRQLWKFDSGIKGTGPIRGVSYWSDGKQSRLFVGIMNFLYALNPSTGTVIESFGSQGRIDLRKGLRDEYQRYFVALTSPGVIYANRIILGFRTVESAAAPPGDIRAFDVRTGRLVWQFHTIPYPGERGASSWPTGKRQPAGGANSWAGMVVDQRRGIVYAPTGSAAPDFYGADRAGDNLYSDSLLALDARTGKRLWHFQAVHHDLWDRDLSSPPVLVSVRRFGRTIDAIAQPTKQGYLFVLNRVTGRTLFPVREQAYPSSDVPGETTSRTQPTPALPGPFARQRLTEEMLTTRTPAAHDWAVSQFRTFRSDGQFVPLRLEQQTVVFPGFDGGAEWGGPAVDPATNTLYINSNDVAWTGGLEKIALSNVPAIAYYQQQCLACHGPQRVGAPPTIPSLVNINTKLDRAQFASTVLHGKGQMPAFAATNHELLDPLFNYASTGNTTGISSSASAAVTDERMPLPTNSREQDGVYEFTGYKKFLDPDGYPAIVPPWGTLNAIELNTGRKVWQVSLGEYPELAALGLTETGSENYGGPIATAGGLVFIGATVFDRKLRAFNSSSGALLWEYTMPFAGTATPATYMVEGRQYLVIATSGARDPKALQGSSYVAFSLP